MPSSSSSSQQSFQWHYADFDDSNFQIRSRTLFFMVVLFAVILLVTFLFLYAQWFCRPPPPPRPPAANLVHAPPRPPPRRGLDTETINSLPIVLYRNPDSGAGEFTETECCICLGVLGDGDKVKLLPRCGHCFHAECVDKWLTAQSSCPLCRSSLRVDSPV